MPDITIVIPFANHHDMIVQRAVESVQKQSAPCDYLVLRDTDQRGPGYIRNRGLERVQTPYVCFLDADDTIAPNFAEKTLEVIKPNYYVYTDWHDGKGAYGRAPTPCKVWTEKTFNLVTTLMFTEDARRIGGFDETLAGAEDTDFGVRLRLSGVCGVHIAQALVMYQPGGVRSNGLRGSVSDIQIQRYFDERYGGFRFMGCCGVDYETPIPMNEKQAGDVFMIANWAGNRPYTGHVTGRRYGNRVGNFRAFWIAEDDAKADPSSWRKATTTEVERNILHPQYQKQEVIPGPSAPNEDWKIVADAYFGGGQAAPIQSSYVEYKPNVPGRKKADVVAKAQERKKIEGRDLE